MSKKLMKKGTPAMIFCNEHARSVWLSRFLKEQSIDNVLMNAGMTPYVSTIDSLKLYLGLIRNPWEC